MPRHRADPDPAQRDIFDNDALAWRERRQIVAVAGTTGQPLTKAQQTFNRLSGQIRRLREDLAMWLAFEDRHRRFVAEKIVPLEREIRTAKVELLRLLDRLLGNTESRPLGKVQRRKLRALLCSVAGGVLGDAPDDEVEAIHDRHARQRWHEQQAAELAEAQAMFGAILGEDAVEGHDAKTFDEFARHMAGRMDQRAREADAQREAASRSGGLGKRAAAAAARKDKAQREASQSVREVFRKLASALHPDREPDAAERERKTRLMQQANEAYARDDLLALLTLQLELDHIDEAHLAGLPDARVALYNRVLRDQVRALEQEIAAATLPLRQLANLPPWEKLTTPAWFDRAAQDDLAAMRRLLREIRHDTEALADPRRRSATIAAIPAGVFDDDEVDAELEAVFTQIDEMLGRGGVAARPRRRRPR